MKQWEAGMSFPFESTKKITRKGRWLAAVFLPWAFMVGASSLSIFLSTLNIGSAVYGIVFTGLPAWPAIHGLRLLRAARRYPGYYHFLTQSEQKNLRSLASQMNVSPEKARRELGLLAKHRLLPFLSISSAGDICFPGLQAAPRRQVKLQRVVCPACGAPGSVEQGSHGRCAYCWGPLSADG